MEGLFQADNPAEILGRSSIKTRSILDGRCTIGDCIEGMPSMPANSLDCVVTSPPYGGLLGVDVQIGLVPTVGEHLDVMSAVFREIRRVLKAHDKPFSRRAHLRPKPFESDKRLLVGRSPIPHRARWPRWPAIACSCCVRSEIIWNKTNPKSIDERPAAAHEKN
ncbi:hypothetical protein [Rhizobium leguminosarum]|uniref:hypothetical protein n=1 Tax=Rhizobium leguminosarum TaxID=384 RepID=UPI00180A5B7C|nr:hypothetical protein [Rhizobium leguminosarum]